VSEHPRIRFRAAGEPRGVVVALHGGRETSVAGAQRWNLAAVRMWPFLRALRDQPVVTGMVQYRYRGWNGESAHPVADALWALEQVHDRYGDLPVVLIGHSMGGRTAVRAAGAPNVRAVAALAPWLPEGEPVEQLAGRTILFAHGDRERTTDPELSYAYARRARAVTDQVCYFDVRGAGHTMLQRWGDWHRLTTRFVLGILGIEPMYPEIENALRAKDFSRVPLSHR
jgi:dienelactone hydrolase